MIGRYWRALRSRFDGTPVVVQQRADPDSQCELALTLLAWGRIAEARSRLLALPPIGAIARDHWVRIGLAYAATGAIQQAETVLRSATDARLDGARMALARTLLASMKYHECAALFSERAPLEWADAEVLLVLAECKHREGDMIAFEALSEKARRVAPESWQAALQHGNALLMCGRFEESVVALHESSQLCPASVRFPGAALLALAYAGSGRKKAALEILSAEASVSASVDVHRTYGQLLLAEGRMVEAWPHYEFRWLAPPLLPNIMRAPIPEWKGQSLQGKRILIRIEQGFGDAFQFLRYAQLLRELGASVGIARFCDLAERIKAIDWVLDTSILDAEIDYFANLLSLPKAFNADLGSLPATSPYIDPDPEKVAHWTRRFTERGIKPKVGIVWAGNPAHVGDRERTVSLKSFEVLLSLEQLDWISLQKGTASDQARSLGDGVKLWDISSELNGFGDTAAVIANLDLVISVDTSVAHLAGALGKPVWVLLGTPTDWRWFETREDTPWYPTMALFRKARTGAWIDVFDRVRERLLESMNGDQLAALSPRAIPSPPLLLGVAHGGGSVLPAIYAHLVYATVGPILSRNDGSDESKSLEWYGEFLELEVQWIGRFLRQGDTALVFDSASVSHVLALSKHLAEDGHLYVLGAGQRNDTLLKPNLALHNCENVSLIRHGGGLQEEPLAPIEPDSVDSLQLERLNALFVPSVTNAASILQGAFQTIWRTRPMVIFRLSESDDCAELIRIIDTFGYRAWTRRIPMFRTGNFNRRQEDIFDQRCVLALIAIPDEAQGEWTLEGLREVQTHGAANRMAQE